jgi:hypothetical protein
MKQTAVEWLENEFKEAHKMFGGIDTNWIKRFEQAKAMEKEQMRQASCPYIGGWEEGEFEDWYNETYNKDESKTNL